MSIQKSDKHNNIFLDLVYDFSISDKNNFKLFC